MEGSNRQWCAKGDEEASRSPHTIHYHKLGMNCHPVLKTQPRKGWQERDSRSLGSPQPAGIQICCGNCGARKERSTPAPQAAGAAETRELL